MRNLHLLDAYRRRDYDVIKHYRGIGDDTCGVFVVPSPIDHAQMMIIASSGDIDGTSAWDHVSVSRANRCPNWPEMDYVKRLFFKEDEVAMQLHVAISDHISIHPNCLHLWRPHAQAIPLPPKLMVGAPI